MVTSFFTSDIFFPFLFRHQARQNWRTGSQRSTLLVPQLWLGSTTGRIQCDCCEPRSASWSRRLTWTRRWKRWETCSCRLSPIPRRGRPYWSRYGAGILSPKQSQVLFIVLQINRTFMLHVLVMLKRNTCFNLVRVPLVEYSENTLWTHISVPFCYTLKSWH